MMRTLGGPEGRRIGGPVDRRTRSSGVVLRCGAVLVATAALGGCAKKPPADFAPDPGLVARIREIRMEVPAAACPGQTFRTDYVAVLDDGAELPFATSYDEDHPPALHVVFLSRYSAEATALENGNWAASPDPLASAVTGFRLRALMRANPQLTTEVVVPPSYECLDHTLEFMGARGRGDRDGGAGPDVTVRLGLVTSPFVQRLVVAEVTVEQAPPLYVVADAADVDPADWLRIAVVGGRGGRGSDGAKGRAGQAGAPGCPGSPGQAGGPGEDGEAGGDGGPGGHVTIIVAEEEPFLAGLVDARTDGGPGGAGGRGGKGGAGGAGGAVIGDARRCQAGLPGPAGADGRDGPDGRAGRPGPRAQVITVPAASVFGSRPRPELQALLTYQEGARQ